LLRPNPPAPYTHTFQLMLTSTPGLTNPELKNSTATSKALDLRSEVLIAHLKS